MVIKMKHKKIALFGFPASGKSTFSVFLSELYNIPKYSLDEIRWAKMKDNKKDEEYFNKEYEKLLSLDEWIIEGNALDTIQSRLDQSDLLYFFDTGVEESLKNYFAREEKLSSGLESRIGYNGKADIDAFPDWLKNRYAKKIERLKPILENYKDKLIVIHNYDELNMEIERLKEINK